MCFEMQSMKYRNSVGCLRAKSEMKKSREKSNMTYGRLMKRFAHEFSSTYFQRHPALNYLSRFVMKTLFFTLPQATAFHLLRVFRLGWIPAPFFPFRHRG